MDSALVADGVTSLEPESDPPSAILADDPEPTAAARPAARLEPTTEP